MKIVCISDTHGKHKTLTLPAGDVLIHAGDLSLRGSGMEIERFLDWFSSQPYTHKIAIAGNHDFFLEMLNPQMLRQLIPENIMYLNDSGCTIEDINFWGSPIQPKFYNWAFNRNRGADIKKHWDLIPKQTDVLITHGPPFSVLDKTKTNEHVGCKELLDIVYEVKPKIHVFGHIHEGYGVQEKDGISFVNASVLNANYEQTNAPIVLSL